MIELSTIRPFVLALLVPFLLLISSAARSDDPPRTQIICLSQADDCKTRLIRLPDGLPGQVLKFEFCQEGDCDRAHREHWSTHYLVPPPGEVCRYADVTEALNWIEQNRKGWLLAGWGCVSSRRIPV
jgi:hypothetical protein